MRVKLIKIGQMLEQLKREINLDRDKRLREIYNNNNKTTKESK